MSASDCCFRVLLARPFTHSLPNRIASMVDMKQSSKSFYFFKTANGDFSGGFRNELAHSLTNGNHFSSLHYITSLF